MSKHTAPRSAKRGNAPSPYTMHKKAEFNYAPMYARLFDKEPDSPLAKHIRQKRKIA